ncbi:hypothetical protein SO802_021820 [Lithocarpus litseifolius]|uniref:SWIM-type domain-containing protein n=1 Tax=Lithocarpus litseifolius TaxID=425828 RepID=A0AAW2CFV8_9ROSI
MLECIRVRLMTRLYTKREGIQKYAGKLCSSIQDKLEKLKVESKPFSATPARSFFYEVASQYERHVVDLVKKTYSCRYWDLNGIPCKHAITAIYTNFETPETYTHLCYQKETYMEIYKKVLPPMPSQSKWVETGQLVPLAPHIYKPPGSPPKQRKKVPDKPRNPYKASRLSRPVRYGKCKKEGHNSRGCKVGITGETPWQRRQRLEREKAGCLPRKSIPTVPVWPAIWPNRFGQQCTGLAKAIPVWPAPLPTNRSTGGVRIREQLAAQRPPKMNLVGGKSKVSKQISFFHLICQQQKHNTLLVTTHFRGDSLLLSEPRLFAQVWWEMSICSNLSCFLFQESQLVNIHTVAQVLNFLNLQKFVTSLVYCRPFSLECGVEPGVA